MDRVTVGDIAMSRVAWGTMRVDDMEDASPNAIRARLEACLEVGITTLDCADIYGGYTVEEKIGAVLREDRAFADRFEIVTKCGIQAPWGERADLSVKYYDTSRDYIRAQVERSRDKLGVDVIDLLLIHRPDPFMDAVETGRALDEVVASGEVRAVGVSNFRPWDMSLLQSATGVPLVCNQIEVSLSHLSPFTDGDLAFVQEHGVVPMAWSPLGGGGFHDGAAGKTVTAMADAHACTPAQIALAFLLAHPAGIVPVIGTHRPERIREVAGACNVRLSRVEWFTLYSAAMGAPVP